MKLPIIFGLIASLTLPASITLAQQSNPAVASLGTAQSGDSVSSLQGTLKYQVSLDDIFWSNFDPSSDSGSLFDITPDVFLNFSEGPQFNSVVLRFTGNYIAFSTVEVAGAITPDSSKTLHVFPISLGLEADQSFDNASLIAEAGYVPYRLSPIGDSDFRLGVNPRVGIFAQAGYKFGLNNETDVGNGADESSEVGDSEIARLKFSASVEVPLFEVGKANPVSFDLLASADLWYDFVNDEIYNHEEVILRVGLNEDQSLDFKYENGSGAPNFNQGDQFGVFLSTSF